MKISSVPRRWIALFASILILPACSAIPEPERLPAPVPRPPIRTTRPALPPAPRPAPRPSAPWQNPGTASTYQRTPPPGMMDAVKAIWAGFESPVGIAIGRADGEWLISFRGDERFPQQSVSKTWVTLTLLDAVDKGRIRLDEPVTITEADRVVFSQPITEMIDADGYQTTYGELIRWAMSLSDNLANDRILRRVGGPDAVRSTIAAKGLGDIRFGPGESLLQAETAGLPWRPEYTRGRSFQEARGKLPMDVREKAIWRYIGNPSDGASPNAIARALIRLHNGELLSRASTDLMLQRMGESRTGPKRLKAGLPGDWKFVHKTGTGQDLFGLTAGYNDTALATAPDGTTYAIVVMIRNTRASIPKRMAMMQSVSRAVASYHQR